MWSLPEIKSLNARATANLPALRREQKRKFKPNCEVYGCTQPAIESVEWFDIFSDTPKGLVHVCGCHSPEDVEGNFRCDGCQRILADHYTWERYQTTYDGETLCLKCAAERYFADDDHWIDPRAVKAVVLDASCGAWFFDAATGVLNVARCRHVLGVSQPLPQGIKFVENFEFDSLDGHQISGGDVLETIRLLTEPFCPVLDAAYQFAVSIGLYTRQSKRRASRRSAKQLQEAA
jgi:hypothetical protein